MPFCAYCGTRLEEGETCTCAEALANANHQQAPAAEAVHQSSSAQTPPNMRQTPPPAFQQAPPQFQQTPPQFQQAPPQQQTISIQVPVQATNAGHKIAATGKSLIPFLKNYFQNPRKAVETVIQQNDMTIAVGLTILRLLAMGLAVYGILRKVCMEALNVLMRAALYGSSTDMLTADLSASFLTSILYGALIGAAGMALFFVLAFVLSKLSHSSLSASAVFEACAANSIFTTLLLLLSFLMSFVSVPAFLVCMLLTLLTWVITGVLTAQIVCEDHCTGLFWLIYFIGASAIFFIGYKLYPQLFLRAIGGIKASYMGQTITLKGALDVLLSEIRSKIGEFDSFSDALNDMLTSLWWDIY